MKCPCCNGTGDDGLPKLFRKATPEERLVILKNAVKWYEEREQGVPPAIASELAELTEEQR